MSETLQHFSFINFIGLGVVTKMSFCHSKNRSIDLFNRLLFRRSQFGGP